MIMITAVVTIMVTVLISTVARYVNWQLSVLGEPLYRFITWHILLFAIALALFYDRRQGYKKSIGLLGYIMQKLRRQSHEGKVNATMGVYREHARKFRLKTVLMPVAITLFVAYMLSAQILFFAIVTSGSMDPTLKKGDLVFMQKILVKPEVGDIIIYQDPTRARVGSQPLTITHRIVEISADTIKTKGDNNPNIDSWSTNRKNILGKAVILNGKPFVLRDVGKYFLQDFTVTEYNAEFLAIAKTIQNLRAMGIMLFFVCIALYLIFSVRDARASKHFKYK